MNKAGSIVPAVASAALFGLTELRVASEARSAQLLTAALLLAALAATHTHAVLGKGLSGWCLFQPFRGGACFVVLQACGWTSLATVGAAVLLLVATSAYVPGFASALGLAQLVAQVALVISLAHFENVHVSVEYWRQHCKQWMHDGMPLSVAAIMLVTVAIATIGAAMVSPPSPRLACWIALAMWLLLQAAGVRIMWTVTWNIGTLFAYALESEEALAVMACIGIGAVCAPWYLGRAAFWRQDFATRAMIGLSRWASEDLCLPLRLRGWYVHEHCMGYVRACFLFADTALHAVPAALLLQHCAWRIRPWHVAGSVALSALWMATLSLRFVVLDFQLLWQGRLLWRRWGERSLFEPHKVGHIYLFENSAVPQDDALIACVPGFLSFMALGHAAVALVAATPWAGEVLFAAGGGHRVSEGTLAGAIVCLLGCSALAGASGFARLLWLRAHEAKEKEK